MFIELTEASNTELTADLCIVGAGAAGIAMALEFADSKLQVIVLESGGMQAEPDTQALYSGEVVDQRLHSPPDTYRQRRFGGTTTIWGGRCMPFDAIDFEQRDFVPHSGWPICLNDLAPHYPKANRLCEAGAFSYNMSAAFSSPRREMITGFKGEYYTTDTLERFSCPTDFGARYGYRLKRANNIRVLMHANVVKIETAADEKTVTKVHASTLQGINCRVAAKHFVLATGGLEVARLLLANRLGTEHDVVGRYYMCHIAGTTGSIALNRSLDQIWHGYDVSDEGVYCRRRLALRPEVQRDQRIGNFVARLHHPRITLPEHRSAILSLLYLAQPLIPYEYAKRLHGDEAVGISRWLLHLRNVLLRPHDAIGFALHMLRDRKLAERKFPSIILKPRAPLFSIDFHAEQMPNPSSRITLDDSRDQLGVPRIKVDWRYTDGDVATVKKAMALLAADFRNSDAGEFQYQPEDLEMEMTRYGAYGGHHIGTARMGTDVRASVVDANCKIHSINNLYVASAAVFPTSSQANPTLTVVALALRLAAHLRGLVI